MPSTNEPRNFVFRRPFRRSLALGWTVLLLGLCLMPARWFPNRETETVRSLRIPHLDKLIHVVLFAGFSVLWMAAGTAPRRWVGIAIAGVVLGLATEAFQSLPFIDRDSGLADALANVLGTVVGIGLARYAESRFRPLDGRIE